MGSSGEDGSAQSKSHDIHILKDIGEDMKQIEHRDRKRKELVKYEKGRVPSVW